MKYKEYVLEGVQVVYKSSILGKETIVINEEVVSEKRSMFGEIHRFELNNQPCILITKREFKDTLVVDLELYKKGVLIEESKVRDKNLILIMIFSGIIVFWLMSSVIV